jgi:[acyl-carrier-protein] S-malonyltransferase
MQEAVPQGRGAMSAVLGLDPARVREICAAVEAQSGEVVSPANYNEPAQTVIAGAAGAVERAGARLKEAGAKRVLPLPVSAPFHCALMAPVKDRLEPVLRGIAWSPPLRPVVTNVEARPNADVARIVPLLVEQVTAPVRWIECVEELVRQGVTRIVEVGPGKVLSGLAKRIDKSVEVWNVEDRASLEKALAGLGAQGGA